MDAGLGWLKDMMEAHASQPVVYIRGHIRLEMMAILGRTESGYTDSQGYHRLEASDADFILDVSLLSGAGFGEPQLQDEVHRVSGANVLQYSLFSLGGTGCWSYSDPYGKKYRVHTKLARVL